MEQNIKTILYPLCTEAKVILNIDSVPESSIINALARGGVSTIQDLKEADVDRISKIRCIGAVRLGIIIKMKEIISRTLTDTILRESIDIVYAYSLFENIFACHEGIIAGTKNSRYGIFRSSDHYNTTVTTTSGEVYNGVLWLSDKNDEEAIKLFILHYSNKNEELKRQIENNNNKLQILKTLNS